jgi:hypothetical protein
VNDQRTIRIDGDFAEVLYDDSTRLLIGETSSGQASDGFHTFDELYRHRLLLTAALFRQLYENESDHGRIYDVHKSRLHSDGLAPFDDTGWFIVVAQLPTGQISYHYRDEDWDLFKIPERQRAAEWDGHSAQDAADRLEAFLRG